MTFVETREFVSRGFGNPEKFLKDRDATQKYALLDPFPKLFDSPFDSPFGLAFQKPFDSPFGLPFGASCFDFSKRGLKSRSFVALEF